MDDDELERFLLIVKEQQEYAKATLLARAIFIDSYLMLCRIPEEHQESVRLFVGHILDSDI
jgi:hypothetical protein